MKYVVHPLWLVFATVALCGCTRPAQEHVSGSNPEFPVDMLFEHDGVKVYRFRDEGRPVYYVDARGSTSWGSQEGKVRVSHEVGTCR